MAVVLTVGACSGRTDNATPASQAPPAPATIPADPTAALAAAKARLGTESARFAGEGVPSFTGIVNAETRNWEVTGKEYVVRRVGNELYVRASGKTLELMMPSRASYDRLAAGGWVHTRLPNGSELSTVYGDKFPWNLANPATKADGMTKTGTRSFSGKLSVTNAKAATEMRVTADLDEQGRFTRIGLTEAAGSATAFTFSDYGTKADIVAPPARDVAEEENPSFLSAIVIV
ncbi:hypothetical protein ACQPZX_22110 [Actinoplanes sp. CA-142083]|uniref:hypothetical protein n=1 Tax=Actinoplanes sp. CA-142083 TaxID=3239903 RepID=UPI003D911140